MAIKNPLKLDKKRPLPEHCEECHDLADVVDEFLEHKLKLDEATKSIDTPKKSLSAFAKLRWLSKKGAFNNLVLTGNSGGSVMISFKDQYPVIQDDSVLKPFGDKVTNLFQYQNTMSINFSAVPEDKQQEFFDRVKGVAKEMGLDVDTVMPVRTCIMAKKSLFHNQRHTLTPYQNAALERIVPVQASVSVREQSSHMIPGHEESPGS